MINHGWSVSVLAHSDHNPLAVGLPPAASPATADCRASSKKWRGTEGVDVETPKASRVWGVGRGFPPLPGQGLGTGTENFEILSLEKLHFGAFSRTFKQSVNLLQLAN